MSTVVANMTIMPARTQKPPIGSTHKDTHTHTHTHTHTARGVSDQAGKTRRKEGPAAPDTKT